MTKRNFLIKERQRAALSRAGALPFIGTQNADFDDIAQVKSGTVYRFSCLQNGEIGSRTLCRYKSIPA